jgi:hypothetical protein
LDACNYVVYGEAIKFKHDPTQAFTEKDAEYISLSVPSEERPISEKAFNEVHNDMSYRLSHGEDYSQNISPEILKMRNHTFWDLVNKNLSVPIDKIICWSNFCADSVFYSEGYFFMAGDEGLFVWLGASD